jgi:hypothetical protein
MTDLAMHTSGLGKRFGERAALEHIDLEVPRAAPLGSCAPTARARRR